MNTIPWPQHNPILISQFAENIAKKHAWHLERCEYWREGASNAIWVFDTDKERAILKIGKLEHWRRLSIEAGVLECAGGDDTPQLLAHGQATEEFPWDWAILGRVDGIHPYALDACEALELGKTLTRIRTKTQNMRFDEGGWKRFVEERIHKPLDTASKFAPKAVIEHFTILTDKLAFCDTVGSLLDELPAGIVHGDLIPLNLIKKDKGGFCLLDWENPRRASAAWDLAGVRKAFILKEGAFEALSEGLGAKIPEIAIDFADALQQLQVAAWRAESWFGHAQRHYGDSFLIELGQELGRAELLLNAITSS